MRHKYHILSVLTCLTGIAFAQQSGSGEATKASKNAISNLFMQNLAHEREILVYFTSPTTGDTNDVKQDQITITFLPSKKAIPRSSITDPNAPSTSTSPPKTEFIAPFGNELLQIGLKQDDSTTPENGDTQIQVSFVGIHFTAKTLVPLSSTGVIYDKSNIKDLVDLTSKALASAKTTQEKDLFASLAVTIPGSSSSTPAMGQAGTSGSAAGGATAGATDINFNRDFYSGDLVKSAAHLFDSASVGFVLKEGNSPTSDPRQFEAGVKLRKTFLIADQSALATVRNSVTTGTLDPGTLQALSKLQEGFIRGFLLDNGGYIEGDAKGLRINNLSNAVYNTQLQIASVARALTGETGFWSFRLMPVGFELGHNLTASQSQNPERGSLARYKAGAQINLHYQAKNSSRRLEFEALTVDRVLFKNENGVDSTNGKVILVPSGNKNWSEANLRFYFGPVILKHRAGVKIDYQRGYLPPTYTSTKAFTYGFVVESTDDDTSSKK